MSQFFIRRPIFAWVIALFIMLAGAVGITRLPIAQYPQVAPPTVTVNVAYPGASAQMLEDSVLALIERELNGTPNMMYMEAAALANGSGTITMSFEPGTNGQLAQIEVQNRIARVQSRLPAVVTQNGVRVDQAQSNFLLFVAMLAGPQQSLAEVADYTSRTVVPELQRIPGVGSVQMFAAERAMRIWLDPNKLAALGLSAAEVNAAIREQNAQISSGALGDTPFVPGQSYSATIITPAQLRTPEEFGRIVLRSTPGGGAVRLADVARIELGQQAYANRSHVNGQPAIGMGVQLSNTGNAIKVAEAIKERMAQLQPYFPQGVTWAAPYDTSRFVALSIQKVQATLLEAMLLVFAVMFVFLQNWRFTLIPAVVVPISLLGTFAVLQVLGYSINTLTMFGMVMVIGIVVDDAIVVVENVERLMRSEGLSPLEATQKAMRQISGAVVGMTVVLISVFVPLAFFSGAVGNIYRQFAVVMAAAIAFSALMALMLTPALCATLLKAPAASAQRAPLAAFYAAFNRRFDALSARYGKGVAWVLAKAGRMALLYALLLALAVWVFGLLPKSFLPQEDQGYVMVTLQLPPGATLERTEAALKATEAFVLQQPEVQSMVGILGFSFAGQGQNMGFAFVPLKDWSERRGKGQDANALVGRINAAMANLPDGMVMAMNPPAIPALGRVSGFALRLQDRAAQGRDALLAARNQFLGLAGQSKLLAGVRPEGQEDAPQLQIDIDRERAAAQGVSMSSIASALATALGSSYVNDFPNRGRMQRVVVQAEAARRMQPEDVLRIPVLNNKGQTVLLEAVARTRWITGTMMAVRYNGYPAMRLNGGGAPGVSTGQVLDEVERLAQQLPRGFATEWTGQSREERLAGKQAIFVYAFAILSVFLCLAALYESWSIPLAVMLSVALGLLGMVLGILLRGMQNDVYFQVGLVTIIGLSAKNAILIVEFAKDLQAQGESAVQAALHAARLRLRPILMTSLAFMLGVLPLYFASGAGSGAQRAIGTGVFWGMAVGTVLALFFVPVFYVLVRRFFPHALHAPRVTL